MKALVAQLHAEKRPEAGQHHRIHRPWGWYQRIDIGNRFQVKHICVKPAASSACSATTTAPSTG